MEPVQIVCPYFGGRSPVVIYDRTTVDLPPKHRQTLRAGSIEEFVLYVWICSMYTNSSMEPARCTCPCLGATSAVVNYDLKGEVSNSNNMV